MRLLDSQAARWLLKPAGRPASLALRLAGRITSYVARELERFAGGDTLSSIADFFVAAAGAAEGIAARMRKVSALLRSPAVRFILVTTAEPDRLRQARRLIDKMESEGLHLGAIVINRFLDEAIYGGLHGSVRSVPLDDHILGGFRSASAVPRCDSLDAGGAGDERRGRGAGLPGKLPGARARRTSAASDALSRACRRA